MKFGEIKEGEFFNLNGEVLLKKRPRIVNAYDPVEMDEIFIADETEVEKHEK